MQKRIMVGGISPAGDHLLRLYLDKFVDDYLILPLSNACIKSKIRNTSGKPDVLLVILDESQYNACLGVASEQLKDPKVHKYTTDAGLLQFLIQKFGVDLSTDTPATLPPDKLVAPQTLGVVHTVSADEEELVLTETATTEVTGAEVQELKDKIAENEVLIRNLTRQLEDGSNDDDIKALTTRIRELEEELENASRLSQDTVSGSNDEIESLKSQLDVVTTESSKKDYRVSELESQVALLQQSIEDSRNDTAELSVNAERISELTTALEEEQARVASLQATLDAKAVELTEAVQRSIVLEEQVSSLSSTNTEVIELKAKVEELMQASDKAVELGVLLEEKTSALDTANQRIVELTESLSKTETDLIELLDSDKKLKELEQEKADFDERLSRMKERLNDSNLRVAELESQLSGIENSSDEIERLRSSELDLSAKVADLEKQLSDVDGYKSRITELTEKLGVLESSTELSETKELFNTASEELEALRSEYNTLKSDSTAKLDELQGIIDANVETISRLTADLDAERKSLSQVKAELSVAKTTADDTEKVAELRTEVSKLKSELALVNANADVSELKDLKERYTTLEMDFAELDNEVTELKSGVFGRMSELALPRAMLDIDFLRLGSLPSSFTCFAGGSNESNLELYDVIERSVAKKRGNRVIILDLTTDSYIDSKFAIQKASSPIGWLSGSEPVTKFIANTKYAHVKVITVALAYLNELSLLTVDWNARLRDLLALNADHIVVNLGCFNTVSKLLFSAFSSSMKGHVVLKATPINLRSLLLNLSGLKLNTQNVFVTCTGFDSKSAHDLYKKLTSKYNAQILTGSNTLEL